MDAQASRPNQLTELPAFSELETYYKDISNSQMRQQFLDDPSRFKTFKVSAADLTLDFSKKPYYQTNLTFIR